MMRGYKMFIGKNEVNELKKRYKSSIFQFVVIYGRQRIGMKNEAILLDTIEMFAIISFQNLALNRV